MPGWHSKKHVHKWNLLKGNWGEWCITDLIDLHAFQKLILFHPSAQCKSYQGFIRELLQGSQIVCFYQLPNSSHDVSTLASAKCARNSHQICCLFQIRQDLQKHRVRKTFVKIYTTRFLLHLMNTDSTSHGSPENNVFQVYELLSTGAKHLQRVISKLDKYSLLSARETERFRGFHCLEIPEFV